MSNNFFQFKIELAYVTPVVWRRFIVPSALSLDRLHDIIQIVMGWKDYHLHQFDFHGLRYTENPEESEEGTEEMGRSLDDLLKDPGEKFTYIYDFGDDWMHHVTLEEVLQELPEGVDSPVWCIDGEQACPPEDVGGPPGYEHFCEAIGDKNHPEHEDFVQWISALGWYPKKFDPRQFDPDRVNMELDKYLRWCRPRAKSFDFTRFI